jgi:hypothetical protein
VRRAASLPEPHIPHMGVCLCSHTHTHTHTHTHAHTEGLINNDHQMRFAEENICWPNCAELH